MRAMLRVVPQRVGEERLAQNQQSSWSDVTCGEIPLCEVG
jgi:hypothetical protein